MKPIFKTPEGKAAIIDYYTNILKRWPAPSEQLTIPTRYGSTFVMSSGAPGGDPVVFLHGSATNAAMWMYDAALIGKTHRVYCVDIIGEPGKSDENRPGLKDGNYAKWLTEVLGGLGIDKAAIVGNSLGGWMALDFATANPQRVSHLVLLAAGGIYNVLPSLAFKLIALSMLGKKGVDKIYKMIMGDIPLPSQVTEFSHLLQTHYTPRGLGIYAFPDDALKNLTMPVLYIGGDKDVYFPSQKCADRLAALLPHADTRVLKNTHHALINRADDIAAFLQKNGG